MKKKRNSRRVGTFYEKIAQNYLQAKGYEIIKKNYYSRYGEIDLIANFQQNLAFIEVKYRKNKAFGGPFFSITHTKQTKLIKTANIFISNNNLHKKDCQFDILSVVGIYPNLKIDLLKNAILVNL